MLVLSCPHKGLSCVCAAGHSNGHPVPGSPQHAHFPTKGPRPETHYPLRRKPHISPLLWIHSYGPLPFSDSSLWFECCINGLGPFMYALNMLNSVFDSCHQFDCQLWILVGDPYVAHMLFSTSLKFLACICCASLHRQSNLVLLCAAVLLFSWIHTGAHVANSINQASISAEHMLRILSHVKPSSLGCMRARSANRCKFQLVCSCCPTLT